MPSRSTKRRQTKKLHWLKGLSPEQKKRRAAEFLETWSRDIQQRSGSLDGESIWGLYLFYEKHHGRGGPDAAQWLPEMTQEEEFAVFDAADFAEIHDGPEQPWFYGVRPRNARGKLQDLGTWGQQVAEFPFSRPGNPWHGYPLWALGEAAPENRQGERSRPPKDVFLRMEAAQMITRRERIKLFKGEHT